jgi:hypothetical protein
MGLNWVNNNGPDVQMEQGTPNRHVQPVSPLKRVLLRNIPELANELKDVINAFDPVLATEETTTACYGNRGTERNPIRLSRTSQLRPI